MMATETEAHEYWLRIKQYLWVRFMSNMEIINVCDKKGNAATQKNINKFRL